VGESDRRFEAGWLMAWRTRDAFVVRIAISHHAPHIALARRV
jgi:hypothetical protein